MLTAKVKGRGLIRVGFRHPLVAMVVMLSRPPLVVMAVAVAAMVLLLVVVVVVVVVRALGCLRAGYHDGCSAVRCRALTWTTT